MKDKKLHKLITANVKRIMKQLGWTGYRLFKNTDSLPQSTIYRILDGKVYWSIEYLIEVAHALGVSINTLIKEEKQAGTVAEEKIFERYRKVKIENDKLKEKIARYESATKKLLVKK
jgi:transcriptional regulator with XRE-family HTH domain